MSRPPPEVMPPVTLEGTNGADLLMAVKAVVTALPGDPNGSPLIVNALGGDDAIVRDRTGGYGGSDKKYKDALIDGGSGFDILNYNGADGPITARLDQTWNQVLVGGELVWVQSNSGYSLITSPALPIASENNWVRGLDAVKNIEGIAGTAFGDTLRGNDLANKFWGHDGDDLIVGNGGNDSLWGGTGNDQIFGGSGNDEIHGDDGNDQLSGGIGNDLIHGGNGNDTIEGDQGNDTLYGGAGHDQIFGGAGNDEIHTGEGSDVVNGGSGADRIIVSGFGNNTIDGGIGTDTIVFTESAVINLLAGYAMRGQEGIEGYDQISNVENIVTSHHADVIIATNGANEIRSGDGADWIMALGGDDIVFAGAGSDTVLGGAGNDTIRGEQGADDLRGEAGNDVIWGGSGSDTIRGGAGEDELWGAAPVGSAGQAGVKDVFVWGAGDIGLDQVFDFSVTHDKLRFDDGFLAAGAVADNLLVFNENGVAMLAANIAGHGWDFIARFHGVSAQAMQTAISTGSVFDVQTSGLGDGAPGGFGLSDEGDGTGLSLQFLF